MNLRPSASFFDPTRPSDTSGDGETSSRLLLVCCLCTTFFFSLSHLLPAQNGQPFPTPKHISFEVATVKTANRDDFKPLGMYVYPGGRLVIKQSTLRAIIQDAYDLRAFQVSGGPAWLDQDLYDIVGVPPETSSARKLSPRYINENPSDEQRMMLQTLLAERFSLKIRHTTKRAAVYFLCIGKGPLLLKTSTRQDIPPTFIVGGHGNGGMAGKSLTMQYLTMRLSNYLERSVIDKTGLSGAYDFKLDALAGDSPQQSDDAFARGIFESIRATGLDLTDGVAPVEGISIIEVSKPSAD